MNSSYSRNGWDKKSWLNDMVSSPKFAKDLTSLYADDVIQSVKEDKEFSTIEAAVADMRTRVGLSDEDVNQIRRVATIKLNPRVYTAKQNILNLNSQKLASLIKAYTTTCDHCKQAPCECSVALSPVVRQAMDELGLERLAELHDHMIAGELPEGLKKWQEEHGKKSEKCDEECEEEEKAEEKEAAACGLVKTAKTPPSISEELMHKLKEEYKGDKEKAYATAWKIHNEGKGDKKSEASTKGENMNKEANIAKWKEFLSKKGYLQGSDEKVEKVVSNDPKQLGVPGADEVYPRQNPPVGEVRNWEQKSFEGAAKETAKNLGPKGEELSEKKKLQRAKWEAFLKKADSSLVGEQGPAKSEYSEQVKARGISKEEWDAMSGKEQADFKKNAGK